MKEIQSPSLSARTSLGLGGRCSLELVLESLEDFERLGDRLASLGLPGAVLGAGTNVLAKDGLHELALIRPALKEAPHLSASLQEPERILVEVGAGVPLPRLLAFCRENGLTGMEGLAGIPGSVGGAVAMNAGSFGSQTCACLEWVEGVLHGGLGKAEKGGFSYGYRHFEVAGSPDFIAARACFSLKKDDPSAVAARIKANLQLKLSRQPVKERSAGCVFKNPAEGSSAGVLLEQAGFRGKDYKGLAFSAMHANFLVNLGTEAKAADALDFIEMARNAVLNSSGILLEQEVRVFP